MIQVFRFELERSCPDIIGRKPVFITGAVASSLVMFPYLGAIAEGNWVGRDATVRVWLS